MQQTRSQIARELLQLLDLPVGTANVMFRRAPLGGKFVVSYAPGIRIAPDKLVSSYRGVKVIYEPRKPVRTFVR